MRRQLRRLALLVAVFAPGAGCGGDDAPVDPLAWDCPPGWLATEVGGCGPGVWLCEGDGCAALDPAPGSPVVDDDGVEGVTFARGADGEVVGGWPAVDVGGALADGWAPDGGIDVCPEGWEPTGDAACDPRLPGECGDGAEPIVGGSCTDTAVEDCPDAMFPEPGDVPSGATVLHVLASAGAGGDGSARAPLATLAEGLAAADAGAWVLLGEGTYDGGVVIDDELHVVGVCPARVSIAGSEPGVADAVTARGATADLTLAGVTLTGDGRGLVAEEGASIVAERLAVRGTVQRGVIALGEGSRIAIRDAVVADTRLDDEMARGQGLRAEGGTIEASRVALVRNHLSGAIALEGGSLVVTDSVVRDTEPHRMSGSPSGGNGIVGSGGTIEVRRTVVDRNIGEGVLAIDSDATLADVLIRRTRPPSTNNGIALVCARSTVRATRVLVEDNAEVGVGATGEACDLLLEDAVVRGTVPGDDGRWGISLFAQDGARLEARRVLVEDSADRAAYANEAGTELLLEDVVLVETAARTDGTHGFGVVVEGGATLDATRVLVAGSRGSGMVIREEGTVVSLTDVAIRDVQELVAGGPGFGILTENAASLDADGLRIDRAVGLTLAVTGGADVSLRRVVLREGLPFEGEFGRAVEVQTGGRLRLSGARIEGFADVGLSAFDPETRVLLTDALVADVGRESRFGRGLYAGSGVTLEARRVLFRDIGQVAVSMSGREAPVTASLTDVLVDSVEPGAIGYGIGVLAQDAVELEARRIGLRDVAGAGMALVPRESESSATVTDLWVRGVDTSTVSLDMGEPVGRPVAYGLHVTGGSEMSVTQAVLAGGGYGFHADSGMLHLERAVVTGQLDAAGARTPGADVQLVDLDAHENADDAVVESSDLPSATALPEPSQVCVAGGC